MTDFDKLFLFRLQCFKGIEVTVSFLSVGSHSLHSSVASAKQLANLPVLNDLAPTVSRSYGLVMQMTCGCRNEWRLLSRLIREDQISGL